MPQSFWRAWRASRKLRLGITILVVLVVVAVLNGPIVALIGAGRNPLETGIYAAWEVPSPEHWLGTERYGRDVLAMTVIGLGASLQVGVVAGVLSTLVGVVVAFVAGYKGGRVDGFLATATDMVLVVPSFPLLLTLSAYVRNVSLLQVSLMLAIFSWPFAARTIRSQVLSLRSRPYVDLAKATKLSDMEIIFQELVPNLLPYIGVGCATASLGAIFALVGLEVIGLGPANTLDLGLMLNWAVNWGALSLGAWPIFVAPVVVLSLLFMAVIMINIGLEEVYNPRLRQTAGA
ncbi:MAG TPA: ABC transporter permease [Chloroflexota bacterium]|jgi:peptide/nickel transport system permease protein|nr:ABC transporter permease [Chloroflexota bacterium]